MLGMNTLTVSNDLSFIIHSRLLFNSNNLLSPLPVLDPLDSKIKELMNINLRIFDGINNQNREKKLAILRINFLVIVYKFNLENSKELKHICLKSSSLCQPKFSRALVGSA